MNHRRIPGKSGMPRHFYKQKMRFPSQVFATRGRPYTAHLDIEINPVRGRKVKVTYTNDCLELEAWLQNNVIGNDVANDGALGFDIEWRPQFIKKKLGGKENKTAVLQLASQTSCLVLHIIHLKSFPRHLAEILADEKIRKVGCGVRLDAVKLLKDTGLHCKGVVDLVELASQAGCTREHGLGLKSLANNLLGMELIKPKKVQLSNWEIIPLKNDQIHYAALDAWVGIQLYFCLQRRLNCKNTKAVIDNLSVSQPYDIEVVYCGVCGKKCKGKGKLQEHLANAGHSQCAKCGKKFVFNVSKKHLSKCNGSSPSFAFENMYNS